MTVAELGCHVGNLGRVEKEEQSETSETTVALVFSKGVINSDLSMGSNISALEPLQANASMSFQGIILVGEGFRLELSDFPRLGIDPTNVSPVVRRYMIGRDLMQTPEERYVIDFFGLTREEATTKYPALMQKIISEIKPHRDANKDKAFREQWWLWGRPRPEMRDALRGLGRYIATCRTAKHRVFTFLDAGIIPDAKIIAISLNDAFFLGILSSKLHLKWALRTGAFLEDRPNYNHADCFAKFPFPVCAEQQKERIRELGESLDAHRKRQQAQHPQLTITEMYNVLEKLRRGEPLTDRDRVTHEQGLVSVLRQIHDELDAAVFDAYGWPSSLSDEEILYALVRLNAERAAEERSGTVRWLRPEFQKPAEGVGVAAAFGEEFAAEAPAIVKQQKQPWPKTIPEQARAVRLALASQRGVVTPRELASAFQRGNVNRIQELLQTLVSLGQAREVGDGRYTS
jgi:hypothetical protein